MIFAAVVHAAELLDPVDSGTLEGDPVALAERIAELSGADRARAALAALVAELAGDPTLATALEGRLFGAERRYVALSPSVPARVESWAARSTPNSCALACRPIVFTPLFTPAAQARPRDIARLVVAGPRTAHPLEVPT